VNNEQTGTSGGQTLCRSCGLCCTGHLFIWTKLKSKELAAAQGLGLNVFGSEPAQRGFSQPCSLWEGECTIYASSHYPHACHTYKCKLLKEVLDEQTRLADALAVVQQTKEMIQDVETLLPVSAQHNFRERLVAQIDLRKDTAPGDVDLKAGALLAVFEKQFGVTGLID
jgi:uncharacterized protein